MSAQDLVAAVVIGAGVVGLAVGRALAASGMETLVIERHRKFGEETSSRNSGVIHSGLYYANGSLKARLCLSGREMLYRYCQARGIAHHRCGKLIVAQAHQVTALRDLHIKAVDNGVNDLRWIEANEARALEPAVRCTAGLLSPSTGIVDVHELMAALLGDLESNGGMLVPNSTVYGLRRTRAGIEMQVQSDNDVTTIIARKVVNSAGLSAVDLARQTEGYPAELVPRAYLAKGNYFSCSARPFRHLVYPIPNEAGLGIHATLDLDGSVRFGPDVEWVDEIDYAVDERRVGEFDASIREYWPDLPAGSLNVAYSGIRPKIAGPGHKAADFLIAGPRSHGIPGLINLLGIESPGLTAALAIGDYVEQLIRG